MFGTEGPQVTEALESGEDSEMEDSYDANGRRIQGRSTKNHLQVFEELSARNFPKSTHGGFLTEGAKNRFDAMVGEIVSNIPLTSSIFRLTVKKEEKAIADAEVYSLLS